MCPKHPQYKLIDHQCAACIVEKLERQWGPKPPTRPARAEQKPYYDFEDDEALGIGEE